MNFETSGPLKATNKPSNRTAVLVGVLFFFGLDDFFVGRFQLEEMVDLWLLKGMV